MTIKIDTTFDFYSDTPPDRDPDLRSPTLRRYHKAIWSKPLPDGNEFALSDKHPGTYLHHISHRGEFHLSSDSLGHTYRNVKRMAPIIAQVPEDELDRFFATCSTIGAYIVFPSKTVNRQPTINGARGLNHSIKDRFDLTLECIRRHYLTEDSPLDSVLARYGDFFDLFGSFAGYVEFFLLQDLVSDGGATIRFFLPFDGFETSPLPADVDDYQSYRDRVVAFVSARNRRIGRQFASRARSEPG